MEESETGHLNTEGKRWDANFDIRICEDFVRLNNTERTSTNANCRRLPKREEDDQLDGQNLQKGSVRGELRRVSQLNVKLDQAVHGNRYGNGFDTDNLHSLGQRRGGDQAVLQNR